MSIGSIIKSAFGAGESKKNSCTQKLGKDFMSGMNSVLSGSNHDDVKAIYNKYSDSLTVADANHKGGAYYQYGEGVYMNKENVISGDIIHTPYQTAFHEFGHNIDFIMGNGNPISESWGGGALLNAINADFSSAKGNLSNEEFIDKVKEQAKTEGWSIMDTASVSDILECLTGIDYPLGAGHGADYWVNPTRLPCKEFFAETLDGAAANPGSYSLMERFFPNAVNIVHMIIGGGTK